MREAGEASRRRHRRHAFLWGENFRPFFKTVKFWPICETVKFLEQEKNPLRRFSFDCLLLHLAHTGGMKLGFLFFKWTIPGPLFTILERFQVPRIVGNKTQPF